MIKFSRWLDNLYEPGTQFYLKGNKIADPNAGQQLAAWGGDLAGSVIAAPLIASTAAQIGAGLYNAAAPEALDIPGESLANLAALGAMGYGAYRGISRYNRIGQMKGLRERFADRVPINTAAPAATVAVPVATAAAAASSPFYPRSIIIDQDAPLPPGSRQIMIDDDPIQAGLGYPAIASPMTQPPTGMRFTSPLAAGYSEVAGMGVASPQTNIEMSGAYPSLAASLGMSQPVAPPAGRVTPPLIDGPSPFTGLSTAAVQDVAPATTSGFYGAVDLNALSNPRFGAPLPATQLAPPPANILQEVLTATPSNKSSRNMEAEPVTLTPSYSGINLTSPQILSASDYAGLAIQSGSRVKDIIADDFNRLYKPGWDNDSRVAQVFESIVKEAEDDLKTRAPIGGRKAAFDYI